ncbi:MAG: thermonuclease family protein [Sphingomicrobium sp.]
MFLLVLIGLVAALNWWNRPVPGLAEGVDELFAICGFASSFACVSDGDSFRLGQRGIRVRGINAPESGEKARCDAERQKSDQARDALLAWLNRGAFTMTVKPGDARDQNGRDLRILTRGTDALETHMVGRGMAHVYRGKKLSWCA